MRAFTVTTTKLMQNMMWAIVMVVPPRLPSCPAATKRVSSEEPITTSGVAIGMKISRLVPPRPRKLCRPIANAIKVPSTVATSVLISAISMLIVRESVISVSLQTLVQAAVENSFHT